MKRILLSLLATIGLVGVFQLAPVSVDAQFNQAKNAACEGVGIVDSAGANQSCTTGTGTNRLSTTLSTVLNIISLIAGVIAVIMIIISGVRFMTSGGDPQQAGSARQALIYAVVGIVIVALSQVIVRFVISKI